ncbi:hypothetical protein QQP08_015367 [Theobroma cacao]|nr:hypothetical protein QQP08_015367 [Theobroma cacao]
MESPMSASFKAGASLVPSPVTATTWPFFFKLCTIRSLSKGDDLAITRIFSTFFFLSSDSTASLTPGRHGSFRPTSPNQASTWISSQLCFGSSIFKPKSITAQEMPVVFKPTPSLSNWRMLAAISELGELSIDSLPSKNSITFISFNVRVPVLSVQIMVAEPMVSQAESFRTMALSLIIRFIE